MEFELAKAEFENLSERLRQIHDRLLEIDPRLDRVTCALYDPEEDLLKTFLDSTREGHSLRVSEYRLGESASLSRVARTREARHLGDIPNQIVPSTSHSSFVIEEGYLSSFTVPMYDGETFFGFVFFDSRDADTFNPELQRELVLMASLLILAIEHEVMTVRAVAESVQLAREYSELRDLETGAHLERMARYARIITSELVEELGLDEDFVERVFLYAPLHDLGKIAIPDEVLLKAGPLDAAEWETMKSHTTKGAEMIERMGATLGGAPIGTGDPIAIARNIAEFHHEALDGSGYPRGLVGEQIPLEARIVTVADIFDALTTRRPYKEAWAVDRSLERLWELVENHKIDGRCVAALERRLDEILDVEGRYVEPGSNVN